MATSQKNPKETTLDEDVTKPSTTAPGDGPADTTDPTERATSVTPDKGASAMAGFYTVNAVIPLPDATGAEKKGKSAADRTEEYEAVRPGGDVVTVVHNIDTGETRIK